jgi:DNA-binding beta-propeller fold protein YncE
VVGSKIYKVSLSDTLNQLSEFIVTDVSFNDLRGLDFDSSGNLYIADRQTNNIIKVSMIDYDNGTGTIFMPNYTGLNGPLDIKFDPYDNAYIANSLENNIIKVTPSGIITIFASGLLFPTELTYNIADSALYTTNYGYSQSDSAITYISKIVNGVVTNIIQVSFPYGIVATTTGDIYYTSSNDYYTNGGSAINTTGIIYKLITNNVSINYANKYISSSSGFSISPITSVVFNSVDNHLYVAQYNFLNDELITPNPPNPNGQIWKISNVSPYDPVLFYPTLSSSGPLLNNPTSIVFDATGNLYVVNSANNNLIVIDSTGNTGTLVTITGVSLSAPSAIVFDGSGRLYIANSISNIICILTFSSASIASGVIYTFTGPQLLTPAGLAIDASYENLYISNSGYDNVLKVSLTTNESSVYNLYGVSLTSPAGIYLNNSTGILYVSNLDSSHIVQITNNYTATNVNIVAGDSIISPNKLQIDQPMGLTMNASSLYIANYGNQVDAVLKVSIDISSNIVINSGGLSNPTDTAIKSDGTIYISNFYLDIICRLTPSNNLTTYATLTDNSYSLTINNSSGRLYCLLTSGVVQSVSTTLVVVNFNISGVTIASGARCIRFRSPNVLYIADTENYRIVKVTITTPSSAGTGSVLPITGLPVNFKPTRIAFDSIGNMYLSAGENIDPNNNSNSVYKINMTTFVATSYVIITDIGTSNGIYGIAFDSNNYLYCIGNQGFGIVPRLYRTNPTGTTTELVYIFSLGIYVSSLNYISIEDALIMTDQTNSKLYKIFLSYTFTNMAGELGPYDDTLFIFDVTDNANNFDVSFNVYNPYVIIDPSNIAPNVPTDTNFHFVIPNILPYPTDSYILQCDGTNVSDVFCNNCTYNKEKFLAGTYPTGIVYSTDTDYLYVALQNNTISRVNTLGVVDNNYFPPNLGLIGPTSLVLDASFDMFVLNAGSDFISYLTLRNNIISVNNSFFTGIYVPICLTYDSETDSLYLLSGVVPNTRITRIDARTGIGIILPIAFGVLYDTNGLTIDAYYGLFDPVNNQPPNTKYLYISNTDQNGVNGILQVNLTTGNYEITSLISGLTYKPFTMTNKNDGFLYVANKNNNTLSKISLTGLDPNTQPFASNGISVPVDICFDGSGNLYVANAGTNPRNSRVSKIYTDDFYFANVQLPNGTCANTKIYDITTQSYVELDYYPAPNNYIFPIPIPYPIGS